MCIRDSIKKCYYIYAANRLWSFWNFLGHCGTQCLRIQCTQIRGIRRRILQFDGMLTPGFTVHDTDVAIEEDNGGTCPLGAYTITGTQNSAPNAQNTSFSHTKKSRNFLGRAQLSSPDPSPWGWDTPLHITPLKCLHYNYILAMPLTQQPYC